MRNFILPLLFISFMTAGTCTYATKWRVNNTGIEADFTSASEMINSPLVMNGDTVYFESSSIPYGNVSIAKRLLIIGPGYFLGENDSTQANVVGATLGFTEFNAGSEGSMMKGMTTNSYVSINTSGITLEKNFLGSVSVYAGGHVIIRNYISNIDFYGAYNVLISNNTFTREGYNSHSFSMNGGSATIINNTFLGNVHIRNSVFRNNICAKTVMPEAYSAYNCIVENNIGASTQFGTSNGNQENVDMNTVFTFTGSTDGRYQLKDGSPAIGAGVDGVDCGVFGGNYPYVLSGMVSGPSIFYLNMNGIYVTISAKSH